MAIRLPIFISLRGKSPGGGGRAMSEFNMLCFAENCIRSRNQYHNYSRDRLHRSHTPVKMLHPAHFSEVFTPENLFSRQEQERIVQQLRDYFSLWKQESLAMVVRLIDNLRDNFETEIQDFLRLFQQENEEQLVRLLVQAQQGGELLQILNRYFLERDKTLKQVICEMLSTKEETYQQKFTALHDSFRKVFSKFHPLPPKQEEPLQLDQQTLPVPLPVPLPLPKPVEIDIPQADRSNSPLPRSHSLTHSHSRSNNSVVSLENRENLSEVNSKDSHEMEHLLAGLENSGEEEEQEKHFRARINNVYSFAIMNVDAEPQENEKGQRQHREERQQREQRQQREDKQERGVVPIEEKEEDEVVEVRQAGRGKSPPKRKSIKKEKERRREQKKSHCAPPLYDNLFLQIDMDYFFSKSTIEPEMPSLSDCVSAPYFSPDQTSLCLKSDLDIALLQEYPTLQSTVQSLTLSHEVKMEQVVPHFLNIEERLVTLHLKDIYLREEQVPKLRQLLRCHSGSLQCLMLEACWNLPTVIVEDIAKLKNLSKLKLHSTYNRPFPLQLRLLFALKELQYLSIGSAQFVDSCGDLIEYGSSRWLEGIRALSKLLHLGLYNCNKVYSDLLGYLHESVYARLTYLNLGITDIDEKVVEHLRRFESLLYLNVDETQLSGADLVRVFSGRKDVRLRELSLVNLNGVTWNEMNRGYTNGLLKCLDLERLADCLPHLEYISLLGCPIIQGFDLQRFKSLKYAYAQEGSFNRKMIKKFQLAKIQVFIERVPQAKPQTVVEPETKVEYDPYTSSHFLSDQLWE